MPNYDLLISLNYDTIVDNAVYMLSDEPKFPDYAVDISTEFYRDVGKVGKLLKLHGSLNWLYCPGCDRLELGIGSSGRNTVKVLDVLYAENPLETRYGVRGTPCLECGSSVHPVLITPTHLKDYRNPHISRVWYEAERILRWADRVIIIIGYSLPEDGVEVTYLLKRGLVNVPPSHITVVEFDPQGSSLEKHPVGRRYRSLFGNELDWHTEGFGDWVNLYGGTCISN